MGIWVKDKKEIKKIAAIGIRISKWIAFHGFSININNDLNKYKKIITCGIKDKGITNLNTIKKQDIISYCHKIKIRDRRLNTEIYLDILEFLINLT